MKMNYLLDKKTVFSNRPNRQTTGPWRYILVILFLVLAGGLIAKALEPSNRLSAKLVGAIGLSFSKPNEQLNFLSTRRSLVESNKKLQEEIADLKSELLVAKGKIEDLEAINQEFGPSSKPENISRAKIILRTGYFSFDTFWLGLEKTASTSIQAGSLVISDHNIILGEIIGVYGDVAKAKLYSAPNRKTAVRIGEKNIPTLATGLGGGNYLVTLPTATTVVHNDLVRTEKNGKEYILGIVGTVEKNAETPFQKVYIKPPLNIYELRYAGIAS